MPTSGRSAGSSRRRTTRQTAAAPIEPIAAPAAAPVVELLDDRSTAIAGGRRGLRFGRSLPGAIAGTLLVVGLAFGAALGPDGDLSPASDRDSATDPATAGHEGSYKGDSDGSKDDQWGDGPDATDKPDNPDGEHPDATKQPAVEPTPKPDRTPKPTEKPRPDATAKPPAEPIDLVLAIKEYHPAMQWGSCDGLGFDYYKVVRSTNSTVTWPPADGDEVIAAVERGGTRKAYDKYAAHGHKLWYRVFCVRKGEDGYKVVASSATKGIEVPEEPAPPPTPDPIDLGLEAGLADGGKVLLNWTACDVDGFAFYKVLRSTSNDDPSYLPWHDGTEVVGVVSEMGATQLEVPGPGDAGTAYYRVQCLGYYGDTKVLLGESAAVAVTVP